MAEQRPSRWEKTKSDWSGIRAKREAVVGIVGALATAGVQVLVGSAGAVDTLITAAVGAAVTVVAFPAAELGLRWLQAPMRLLTDDVIAIRQRMNDLVRPTQAEVKQPPNVRLTLLNFVRMGKAMLQRQYIGVAEHELWAGEIAQFLSQHVDPADAELFVRESEMLSQLSVLADLAEKY